MPLTTSTYHECWIDRQSVDESLGLRLYSPVGSVGCRIQAIVPDSPVDRSNGFNVGDRIVGIDSIPVDGLQHAQIISLLKLARRRVLLAVERTPAPPTPSPFFARAQIYPASCYIGATDANGPGPELTMQPLLMESEDLTASDDELPLLPVYQPTDAVVDDDNFSVSGSSDQGAAAILNSFQYTPDVSRIIQQHSEASVDGYAELTSRFASMLTHFASPVQHKNEAYINNVHSSVHNAMMQGHEARRRLEFPSDTTTNHPTESPSTPTCVQKYVVERPSTPQDQSSDSTCPDAPKKIKRPEDFDEAETDSGTAESDVDEYLYSRRSFVLSGYEYIKLLELKKQWPPVDLASNTSLGDSFLIRALLTRNCDIESTICLLKTYVLELRPEIDPENIHAKDCIRQLQTGALALTGGVDVDNGPVIEFVAGRYNRDLHTPMEILKAMMYLIEIAYKSDESCPIRSGISIVMDLRSLSLNAFDYKFMNLFFNTIQTRYPVEINQIHVLSNTLLIKTAVSMCGIMAGKYLRRRVRMHRSCETIYKSIFPDQLSKDFHGYYPFKHGMWIYERLLAENSIYGAMLASNDRVDTSHIRRQLDFESNPKDEDCPRPRSKSLAVFPGMGTEASTNNSNPFDKFSVAIKSIKAVGDLFWTRRRPLEI